MDLSLMVYLAFLFVFLVGYIISWNNMKTKRRLMIRIRQGNQILSLLKGLNKLIYSKYIVNLNPVITVTNIIRKNHQQKIDREIFESIIFLRNLVSLEEGRNTSTDYILQRLSEQKGLLRVPYIKMLGLLRTNKRQEAVSEFTRQANTPASRDFARLLIRWDEISPSQLMEILISHEKNIKEIRGTYLKRKDEIISDLIYLPVVLNVFFIFINFIYVAYFVNQRELLQLFM